MTEPTAAASAAGDGDRPRIVVLMAGGALGWIVVNGLRQRLGPLVVIEEAPESKIAVIKRRLRLVGPVATAGQIAFGLVHRLLEQRWRSRLADIWRRHGLFPAPDPAVIVHPVASVNSDACRSLLRQLAPDVVAVYGTRIIGRATLSAVPVPFINYHAGINPKYRGQHPAYWARADRDEEHCGVTIHLVDHGVDTGEVLYQARVELEPQDTIGTYQHVQAATALPLLARAIGDALAGRLDPRRIDLPSRLWFPPTLWGYLATGLRRGVW